jgi:hypothetical protein
MRAQRARQPHGLSVRGLTGWSAREFLRRLLYYPFEGVYFSVDLQEMQSGGIVHSISARR